MGVKTGGQWREQETDWKRKVKTKSRVLLLFTRNLALMVRSGMPLVDSLETLTHQDEDPRFGRVVADLATMIGAGHTLSKSMSTFPGVFSTLYYRMVEVGEQTGGLARSLQSLAAWSEKEQKLKSQMKSALSYPFLVLTITFLLTVALLTIFVPRVLNDFGGKESELPAISRGLLLASATFQHPGFWVLLMGIMGLLIPHFSKFLRTPRGATFLLHLPLLGRLLLFGSGSRYALTLSTLLSNGVGLRRALGLSAVACGSAAIELDGKRMREGIDSGESLADLLAMRPHIYPIILIQMVRVGEETSNLADMLEHSAKMLAQDAEYLLEALVAALEPLVMAIVAVVVGTVLIGVFASIYSQLGKL